MESSVIDHNAPPFRSPRKVSLALKLWPVRLLEGAAEAKGNANKRLLSASANRVLSCGDFLAGF